MKARPRSLLVTLVLTGAIAAASTPPAQSQAVEQMLISTDYELPPATLDLAWQKTPIIVRVRLMHSERHEGGAGGSTVPVTRHDVEVLEAFKGAGIVAGMTLVLNQDSAEPLGPKSSRHMSGGPILRPGREYVLFLERPSNGEALGIAWGPSGVFDLDDDMVTVPGGSRRMWGSREELPRQEFLATLRKLQAGK